MRIGLAIFTTPLLWMFNILMGKKSRETKSKEEKIVDKEKRQRRLLERLGFAQMMFDFYRAPVP
jgi:hypothetical protein